MIRIQKLIHWFWLFQQFVYYCLEWDWLSIVNAVLASVPVLACGALPLLLQVAISSEYRTHVNCQLGTRVSPVKRSVCIGTIDLASFRRISIGFNTSVRVLRTQKLNPSDFHAAAALARQIFTLYMNKFPRLCSITFNWIDE